MRKNTGEAKSVGRYLKRKGEGKKLQEIYTDNRGNEYTWKWLAIIGSFCNFIDGGFKSGFPIATKYLWTNAWTFYPFVFVKMGGQYGDISTFNHERIHIHQQRDLIGVALVILLPMAFFYGWELLNLLLFVPSIIYGVEVLIRLPKEKSWEKAISNTSFEKEANMYALNTDYLLQRPRFQWITFVFPKLRYGFNNKKWVKKKGY